MRRAPHRLVHLALVALTVLALAATVLAAGGCATDDDERRAVLLWHSYQGTERTALERAAAAFNADSEEVRVRLVSVPYAAFADKITNAIPNGNGPDLFIFAHDRMGDWVATGVIEPIEYYVDEALAERFAFDALAAMAYEDSLYGLPLAVKSVALFYRTDMIAEPPRTTDELLRWGQEYSRNGRHALVYDNVDLYGHAAWLHGFGGAVFDREQRLTIATPEATAALLFARELSGIVPQETTGTMVASLFNRGRAAMAISGPWFIGDIADDVPWAVTTLPIVSPTGQRAAPFLGAEGVMMSSRARDKDAAFLVMAALTGDAPAADRARTARQVVPNLAAYEAEDIGGDPVLAAFRDQLAHTVPMPATPAMRTVWTPYKSALQRVIAQGADPADALLAAEREIQSYSNGAASE
jgi:maltose-binding protein MalE